MLVIGFAAVHLLTGGTRLLFALPGYGAIALAAVLSVASLRRISVAPERWAVASAIVFFGYIAIRAALSPVAYLAWPDLFSAVACLAVYLLFACHLTNPGIRLGWVAALALLAMAGVLVGAHQMRLGGDWMPFGFLRAEVYRGRASGFLICPNHLAGFLEVVAVFALSISLWSRLAVGWRILAGYFAVVCVGGVLMSGSRGGFLSLGAGLMVVSVLSLTRWRRVVHAPLTRPVLIASMLLVVAAATAWVAVRQSSLLEHRAGMLLSSEDVRLRLWPAAIEQAKLSPGFGTGAGSFLYYARKFRPVGIEVDPVYTHNDYLQLLAEFGIAGAVLALFFAGAHFRSGLSAFRQLCGRGGSRRWGASNAAALNIGALASVVAYAAHSVVDFNLQIPANALLLAAVGGMLANPSVEIEACHGGSVVLNSRQLLPRLALIASGIWLAVFALPKLPGEWYAEQSRLALRDGRWLESAHFARLGLERETQNFHLPFQLGESQWEQSQHIRNPAIARSFAEAAVQPYRDALALFPQDSQSMLKLAWVLSQLGQAEEADAIFATALRWDPNSGALYTFYGHHLRTHGETQRAIEAYRRAVQLSNNPDAAANLAVLQAAKP